MIAKPVLRAFILVLFLCHSTLALLGQSEQQAVSGTVSGVVQKVGFRAMILKQAIRRNLAGTAENLENGTVQFVLQGDADRIEQALKVMRKGTRKSSNVNIETHPTSVDANLKTFTVNGWTSSSRKITTPYNLVFTLRPDNTSISSGESKRIYHDILESAVSPEDLKKLDKNPD